MYSASAVPVVAAPSSDTRPWTSAPSIVKNRRPGLGMSLEYVPSAATSP